MPFADGPAPRKLQALIVDDNPNQRAVLAAVVTDLGWASHKAVDGAAAYTACISTGPFDLILMDYRMPEIDGAEATRKIRALGGWAAGVPIIGCTADWSPALYRWCLQAGMTECVAKPVQPVAFAELLRRTVAPQFRLRSWAAG